jgi:hypothetical protein
LGLWIQNVLLRLSDKESICLFGVANESKET